MYVQNQALYVQTQALYVQNQTLFHFDITDNYKNAVLFFFTILQSIHDTLWNRCQYLLIILNFQKNLVTENLGSERTMLGFEHTHLGSKRTCEYFKAL